MIAAPTTCHHTEMLFMIAIRWLLKMFSTAARARTTTKMMNTRVQRVAVGQYDAGVVLSVRSMNVAQP